MAVRCSHPIAHAVGDIAIAFGNLELFVSSAVWMMLAGKDKVRLQLTHAVTAEMSFDRKVHAFYSMYKIMFPTEADDPDLKGLVGRLFEAQGARNQILHSSWPHADEAEVRSRVKSSAKAAKDGLRTRVSAATPRTLGQIVKQIHAVSEEFGRFTLERIQERVS